MALYQNKAGSWSLRLTVWIQVPAGRGPGEAPPPPPTFLSFLGRAVNLVCSQGSARPPAAARGRWQTQTTVGIPTRCPVRV